MISWGNVRNNIDFYEIIDIRENYLYNMIKIKNSRNIPYKFLIINPHEYLKKDNYYCLLCENGDKSKMLSDILNKNGYHTESISGGIAEYH